MVDTINARVEEPAFAGEGVTTVYTGPDNAPLSRQIKQIAVEEMADGRTYISINASTSVPETRALLENAGYPVSNTDISNGTIKLRVQPYAPGSRIEGQPLPQTKNLTRADFQKVLETLSSDVEVGRETLDSVLKETTVTDIVDKDLQLRGIKPSEAGMLELNTTTSAVTADAKYIEATIPRGAIESITEDTVPTTLNGKPTVEITTGIELRDPYEAGKIAKSLEAAGIKATVNTPPARLTIAGNNVDSTKIEAALDTRGIKVTHKTGSDSWLFESADDLDAAKAMLTKDMPNLRVSAPTYQTNVIADAPADDVARTLGKSKLLPESIANEIATTANEAHPNAASTNAQLRAEKPAKLAALRDGATPAPSAEPVATPVEPATAGESVVASEPAVGGEAVNAPTSIRSPQADIDANRLRMRDGIGKRAPGLSTSNGRGSRRIGGDLRNDSFGLARDAHAPLKPLSPEPAPVADVAKPVAPVAEPEVLTAKAAVPTTAPDVTPLPKVEPAPLAPLESPAPLMEAEVGGSRLAGIAGKAGIVAMVAAPAAIGLYTRKDGESVGAAIGRGYSDTVKGMVMPAVTSASRGDKAMYIADVVSLTGIPASAMLVENRIQTAAAALPQAQVDKFLPEIKGNPNLGSKDEQLNHISKLIYERDQGYPNLLVSNIGQSFGPTKDTISEVDAQAAALRTGGAKDSPTYNYTKPISEQIDAEVRHYMATGGNPETMRETLDPAYARERNFQRLRNLVPDNTYSTGPNIEAINDNVPLEKFRNGVQAGDDRTPEGKEKLMKLADEYYAAYPDDRQTALQFANRSMSRGTTLGATVPNTQQLVEAGFGPLMDLSGKPEDAGTDKSKLDKFIVKDDLYKKLAPNAEFTIDTAEIYSKLSPAQQAQVNAERSRIAAAAPPAVTTAPTPDVTAAAQPQPEAQGEEIVVSGSRYKKGTADKAIPESVRKLIDGAGLASWMDQDGDGKITMREYRQRAEDAGLKPGYDKVDTNELKDKLPKLQTAAQESSRGGRGV